MRWTKISALLVFSLLFLVTRIYMLGQDEINPDAVNWHFRSEQFVVGLKEKDFSKTYQHYHPGVTLMWVIGVPIELARQVNPELRVYNENNFLVLHTLAKFSLFTLQIFLSALVFFLLSKLLDFWRSLGITAIFSLEPFVTGNSRLLHLDMLMTFFVLIAFLYLILWQKTNHQKYTLIAGLFLSLAFLTKSISIIFIPLAILLIFSRAILTKSREGLKMKLPIIKSATVFLVTTIVTTFIVFPALWVKPVYTLSNIFTEGERVGSRRGHAQIVLGEETMKAGVNYYPLVYLVKSSPFLVFGNLNLVVFVTTKLFKKRKKVMDYLNTYDKKLLLYSTVFFVPYILLMTVFSKKIDRYLVPVYPALALYCFYGWYLLYKTFQKKSVGIVILAGFTIFGILGNLITMPYQFTYTSPLFLSSENANKIVAQKPFGMGIPKLKERIVSKYPEYPNIGFIDKKPMSMIYKNSQLFDIRVDGTKKYELIILGPNEKFPENVENSPSKFIKTDAFYINGLEYYRIYVKKASVS